MGFSPALTLSALIALLVIVTVGMVESPENSERLLSLFSTPIGILVLVLRQDYLAYRLEKKTAMDAKSLKQTVAASNAVRDDKLDTLAEKVETVVKQTNGELHKAIADIATDVKQGIEQSNGMKDELVKEVRAAGFAAGAKSETDKPHPHPSPGTENAP